MYLHTCVTCKVETDLNEKEPPMWSKKLGNYSMLPKRVTCEDTFNPETTKIQKMVPKIIGKEVQPSVTLEEKDTWILYWAASHSDNPLSIKFTKHRLIEFGLILISKFSSK